MSYCFADQFEYRHSFDCDDLQVLESKYPNVKFAGIPDAWIVCIDKFLEKNKNVSYIGQLFGQLIVVGADASKLERQVRLIDKDLYIELENGINEHAN